MEPEVEKRFGDLEERVSRIEGSLGARLEKQDNPDKVESEEPEKESSDKTGETPG